MRRLVASPARLLAIVAHGLAMLVALALVAALLMPEAGFSLADRGGHVVVSAPDGARRIVDRTTPVTITGAAGRIDQRAGELVNDYIPDGGAADIRAWYAARDRITAIVAAPGATIAIGGQAPRLLHPRARTLGDLPLDFWLLALQAAVIGGIGAWMRIQRPRDPAAWAFGIACDGVMIAAIAGAVFDARSLSADGWLLQWMQALNFTGSHLCGAGLLLLFLFAPVRIASARVIAPAVAAAILLGVVEGAGLVPLSFFYAAQLVPALASLGVYLVQWRCARGDPVARASLRWIGTVTFVGAAMLSLGMAAPVLLGVPPIASDGMSIVPLLVIFGGIAFGVRGTRLFELEPWTLRLGLGAIAALALLALDAALSAMLNLDHRVGFAASLLVLGYLYLPVRALLLRRLSGHRDVAGDELFRRATAVAFAPDAAARAAGWAELLGLVFEPLAIEPVEPPVAVSAIEAEGRALIVAGTADHGPLRLRFARRGQRLFGEAERRLADDLVALMAQAEVARSEYGRGVNAERRRIARDLHDDVSALLLTALHRREAEQVRGDVRQAMGEIRTMIHSLSGEHKPLAAILADLRYEAAQRLSAGGIRLDWPVDGAPDVAARPVGYAAHKALVSAFREAVSNALRHSGAGAVAVAIALEGEVLRIVVRDDGRGLGAARAPAEPGGHGLANIAARLGEIGGSCRILPERSGFALALVVPLAAVARP